jgi:hypothetical protein
MSNLWGNNNAQSAKEYQTSRRPSLRDQRQPRKAKTQEAKTQEVITFYAVLLHMVGYYVIDQLIPSNAYVDSDVLAIWYIAFAMVDLIAAGMFSARCYAGDAIKSALYISCMWSILLVCEQFFIGGMLQQSDRSIQAYVDIVLFCSVLWISFFNMDDNQ